jgi:hypothetical protein
MAYQIHLPIQKQVPSGDVRARLYAERDRLLARWEKGFDFLTGLRERTGQDTPEFDRYFAAWEQIDADLRRVLDRIECAELTARMRGEDDK